MSSKARVDDQSRHQLRPEDLIPDPNMSEEERAKRKRFAAKLKALQGKIQIELDIDEIRGRRRS